MRLLTKAGAFALTTMVVGTAFVGCSSDSKKKDIAGSQTSSPKDENSGYIGFNATAVDGITIDTVHYEISGCVAPPGFPAADNPSGDIPTQGPGKNFSFGIPLRVGNGCSVTLTAASAETDDNITCTGSFGPFNIQPNQISNGTIELFCTDNTLGTLIKKVNITTDACPDIHFRYAVAVPYTQNVGSPIQLYSDAMDEKGKPLTYEWSLPPASPIGTFAPANTRNTVLNCTTPGNDVLVTITANNGECSETLQTTVSCTSVLCGNGAVDPGEACDNSGPPATDNPLCLANCTLAACGNGVVQAPVEACEPPNTATCTATCQVRTPSCGDTFLTPPEQCEPPNTATCSATCTSVAVAVCGDGQTTGSEVCDVPFTAANCGGLVGTDPNATPACGPIETPACETCFAAAPACGGFDCDSVTGNATEGPANGTSKTRLCNALYDCILDTNCGAGGDNLACYCGNAADCTTGANGACRAQVEAAAESTSFITIGGRFGDPSYASGVATNRIDCARAFSCAGPCGVN